MFPASRKADRIFRDWVVASTPDDIVSTYEDHLPSADGHRIVWIHSTAKARRDATRRHAHIEGLLTWHLMAMPSPRSSNAPSAEP